MKTRDYWLKKVDARIMDAAMKKARRSDPPVSLKWVIVNLLTQWIGREPTDPPTLRTKPDPKVAQDAPEGTQEPSQATNEAGTDF